MNENVHVPLPFAPSSYATGAFIDLFFIIILETYITARLDLQQFGVEIKRARMTW